MITKIACIGAGYFAHFHLDAWHRLPGVEVIAICDKDQSKAEALAQKFGVEKVYSLFDELCQEEEFEVVDIITPPETHLGLCQKAVRHGLHIICQKPLAPSLAEATQIVALTEQEGLRFMVHENFRFQPWYRKIKTLLEDNRIGDQLFSVQLRMRTGDGWGQDAYLGRQPYFRTMPQLFIYETGIHYIDVFRYLIGDIRSVYARLRKLNPAIAGEDCGLVLFDFINGVQGVLDGNRYNEPNYPDPRYTFGETIIEGNQGTIRLYANGKITLKPLGKPEAEIDYHHENTGFGGDCVYFTQQHFLESFIQGKPFETNGRAYLKNLKIQEAIYESARTRMEIYL